MNTPAPILTPPLPPISELLKAPEKLQALSYLELSRVLAPYFPAARTPVLPEEKASKVGLELRVLRAALADPRMAAELAKLKAAKTK